MASYLKPRRGRKSTAETQNFILKRGEIFFEAPESGVGTGLGRIKIGDGTSRYTDLPYFYDYNEFVMDLSNTSVIFEETSISDNNVLFNKIVTGAKVNVITASTKNLIKNINTALNNLIASLKTVAFTNSYNDLDDKPFIPTIPGVVSKSANGLAPKLPNETTVTKFLRQDATWAVPPDTVYTANNGVGLTGNTFYNSGVRAVSINGNYLRVNTNGTNSDLTVSYATKAGSAPASDVYAWAKASSKPSYSWSEITSKPSFATVATSGSYNDLSNKPTIPTNTNQLVNGAGYITSSGSCNYATSAGSAGSVAWSNVTGKPSFGSAAYMNGSYDNNFGELVQRNSTFGGIQIGNTIYMSNVEGSQSMIKADGHQLMRLTPNLSETGYGIVCGVERGTGSVGWSLFPSGDRALKCGTANLRWHTVYCAEGTINTSDRVEKTDIEYFDDDFAKDFIMTLKPTKYKWIDGGKRIHYGLIAQDVEESLDSLGLTSMDFAGLCKDKYVDKDGNEDPDREFRYALRYEEFIAPLIKTVQIQQTEIEELKARLAKLEEK